MGSRAQTELPLAVGLCLVGSAAVLLATSSPWVEALVEPGAPFPPSRQTLTGGDAAPAVAALGLVGLAAVAALLAARRLARLAVGVVLLAVGAGLVALAARHATSPGAAAAAVVRESPGLPDAAVRTVEVTAWPWAAVAGGLLLALAGVLTVARGRSWAGMSGRYDAPGAPRGPGTPGAGVDRRARPTDPDAAAWDALDRGEDPTA